ncbi:uncharacterized protein LOC117646443 isoform X3 [Thrips palmi]|nr:uncharacterized protein LOC117646443 isoform X3 [Thrips palmi]
MTSHSNNPLPHSQPSHQVNPPITSQQQLPRAHQHATTNGYALNGSSMPLNSNGLSINEFQSLMYRNMPKNQLLFDWQSGEVPSTTHRSCRNRPASSELYDSASDESVSQDNRQIPQVSHPYRGIFSEAALQLHRLRMNGQDTGSGASPSATPSEASSHSVALNHGVSSEQQNRNGETNRRPMSDTKKMNIPSSPDRIQVEHRLSQIQDYIKQTSSLIESYRLSDAGATDDSRVEFLVEVLKDLHDSEAKLKSLLSALEQITIEDNLKTNMESPAIEGASRLSQSQDTHLNGNDHVANAVTTTPKSTDSKKQSEIKIKFEESLRQLHALQAEQALLIQKRSEAQEQLQEAQRARNILMALSSNGCPVNAQSENTGSDEQLSESLLNNFQDMERHSSPFRGKSKVVSKPEAPQISPNRELPNRKRQLTESEVTTYLKELMTSDEVKEQASSEDSAVEDAIDEYADARAQVRLQGQIVHDKVAEINALRAQLDQAKSLLNLANRRETRSLTSDTNSVDEAVTDQAINIQRQRLGDSEVAALDGSDARRNKTIKQQLLEQERAKLGRLRGLLATVQEYRSSGLPIPEHILNEFGSEVQPNALQSTSPSRTSGSQRGAQEEDAAAEADAEEDDEPESSIQWNQEQMSLVESASMASELSQGLQQRAAQLQVERDGLAAMQRQLDGLFSQLQSHQSAEKTESANARTPSNAGSLQGSSPSHQGRRSQNSQESKRADEAAQRRMEILSDLHNRWQQLQEEIALDGELNARTAPVLNAAQNALTILASHIHPVTEASEGNAGPMSWDQRSSQGRDETLARRAGAAQVPSQDRHSVDRFQMSSAPSTLMRRKSPTDVARNQRAVWSSSMLQGDTMTAENNSSESMRYNVLLPEETQPVVSMPSPSPSVLQHQTQDVRNRLAALSQSCQSLCVDNTDVFNSSPVLPLMPAIPPPPPPPPGASSHDREAYYQQLLAAGQLQQHQVLLTAVNQCFHMLKMQQHELLNLSNSVHMLSSGAGHVGPVGVLPGVHHSGVHPSVEAGVGVHQGVHQGAHHAVHPGLLQNEEQWANPAPAPCPPTLNNQVPPGNRTNNYWDNFRSYSRQNLLSTSAKSNEGLPHSPSPLVERSHNSLRSSTPMSVPGSSAIPVASGMPQFHSLSTQPCLPGVGSALTQSSGLDSAGASLGAMGPVPTTIDYSLTSPLVQNISRKDKRNIDHIDGGLGSPRRRPSNEIDHRSASRALEDAALPLNSQLLSPTSQEFEVPSMPILRNSVASLQSRLNQVNLNAASSFANLQEFIEAQNTRQQLNNEGVPFSEISSSVSNQQFNETGAFCSLDHARENSHSRRLNMDYHNGTTENEPPSSTVLKRNTGAIKRTYTTLQGVASNAPAFSTNYQRNIHSATTHPSSGALSNNAETSKLSSVFPMSNSDSEAIYKSSKQQSGQDTGRTYNCIGRRPGFQEDLQVPCSTTSSMTRTRIRGINETEDNSIFRHGEETECDDSSALRSVGFNNCQSSASSHSSSSQNMSNVEIHGFGPGKNQLKESCFQIRKCPKYQTKTGARSPLSDSTAVAAAAVAAVAQNSPVQCNPHQASSMKSQSGNCQRTVNKNNQDYTVLNHISGQGQLFEELRESVFAEMTSLISANGSRSHFLVQLLKDLQHISSDSVRQSVLQLIQQAVSRYQIDLSAVSQDGFPSPFEEEVEDDEDEAKRIDLQMQEKDRLPYAGACSSSDVKVSSTQEGETLMQLVLGLELAAVLSGNSEETCSLNLMEDVRSRILQLIPSPPTPPVSNMQASNSTRSASYLHSQIDSVLESVFQKFKGRRIGDIRSEITSCVINALPIKLMYRSMVDFYSCNNMEAETHSRRESSFRESTLSSPSVNCVSPTSHYAQHTSQMNHQEGRDAGLLGEASNGDLAEADQSHHTLNNVDGDDDSEADRDCSTEGPLSAPASDSASTLLHVHVFQLGGASGAPEMEIEGVGPHLEDGEACAGADRNSYRNNPIGAVGGVGLSTVSKNGLEEAAEPWTVEQTHNRGCDQENDPDQEREQGLDRVPTRLACDSDRDQENGEKHRAHHLPMPPNDPS